MLVLYSGVGIDIASLPSGLVKVAVIVVAITIGLGMIGATGVAAEFLGVVTLYLRILAAVAILSTRSSTCVNIRRCLVEYLGQSLRRNTLQ